MIGILGALFSIAGGFFLLIGIIGALGEFDSVKQGVVYFVSFTVITSLGIVGWKADHKAKPIGSHVEVICTKKYNKVTYPKPMVIVRTHYEFPWWIGAFADEFSDEMIGEYEDNLKLQL